MTSNTEAGIILESVLAQIAAEVYWDGLLADNARSAKDLFVLGANHYLRFKTAGNGIVGPDGDPASATQSTQMMVDDFNNIWEVVDHQANTTSGFSATLLRKKGTNEYTLSFRSTESKEEIFGGDQARDSDGADASIASDGFAFAQIRDMIAYYEDLKNGPLAGDVTLNVTGYSLGGHLAQVFTRLYYPDVSKTYTFNGAGMGAIDDLQGESFETRLWEIMNLFNGIMDDPNAYYDEVSRTDLLSVFYDELLTKQELWNAIINQNNLFWASQTDPEKANIYESPLYQLAATVVDNQTSGIILDGVQDITPRPDIETISDPKIVNYFGHATSGDSELVASSGVRYGEAKAVFIEDQPTYTASGQYP